MGSGRFCGSGGEPELLASEWPIFRFRTFWGPTSSDVFQTNLYQPSGRDSPIIRADQVYF